MLRDLVLAVIRAEDDKAKEKAYRDLEKIGVDRFTAAIMVGTMRKEVIGMEK